MEKEITAITAFERTYIRAVEVFGAGLQLVDKDRLPTEAEWDRVLNSRTEASDMVRFSIVLAVAAMDDYFTRKYSEVILESLKAHGVSKALSKILEDQGLTVSKALELLRANDPYMHIAKIAARRFKRETTQRIEKVNELYQTIGISDLCSHGEKRAVKKIVSGETELLEGVREIVERRHSIVHNGDLDEKGGLRPITIEISEKIRCIGNLISGCDEHIDQFLKQK